jgi:hypothetical protein
MVEVVGRFRCLEVPSSWCSVCQRVTSLELKFRSVMKVKQMIFKIELNRILKRDIDICIDIVSFVPLVQHKHNHCNYNQ